MFRVTISIHPLMAPTVGACDVSEQYFDNVVISVSNSTAKQSYKIVDIYLYINMTRPYQYVHVRILVHVTLATNRTKVLHSMYGL